MSQDNSVNSTIHDDSVNSQDNSVNSTIHDDWYNLISEVFTNANKLNRAVCLKSPLLYSSHTIHLLNQRKNNFRQLRSDPSFYSP